MIKNSVGLFWAPLFFAIVVSSCSNKTDVDTDTEIAPEVYSQPTVKPLKFSLVQSINPSDLKTVVAHPLIKKINFNKLPVRSYDTLPTRAVHYEMEETKIDLDNLPSKAFDLDKIPSRPIKFTTIKLPSPAVIKTGQPHLKDNGLQLFELTEAQGLAGVLISCVFTDRDHFEWIATNGGLYRYDGENLLSYLKGPPDGLFIDMYEDADGLLWLATINGGLAILDLKNGTLRQALQPDSNQGELAKILPDKSGHLWINTANPDGVNVIDTKTLSIKTLNGSNGIANTRITGLAVDQLDRVWVSTFKGFDIVDLQKKSINYLSKANGLKSDTTEVWFCDHSGNIWMTNPDVKMLNVSSGAFKTIKGIDFLKTRSVIGLSKDTGGKIWASSQKNGIVIIDPLNQTFRNIKKNSGLADDFTLPVHSDYDRQAWIPTLKGLNKLGYIENLKEHIGNKAVSTQCEDKYGLIWQGSLKGLEIIDRKSKTYRHLGLAEGLGTDSIEYISTLNNKLFICTDNGIDIIDSSRTTITHLGIKEGLGERSIATLAIANDGNIWLGGINKNTYIFNPQNNNITCFGNIKGVTSLAASDMKKDTRGNIWISNSEDLYKLTPGFKTIEKLHTNKGAKTLMFDDRGNLWIGTPHGIRIVDELNKRIITFSKPQGLINEHVVSLLKYHGHIYATTLKGLSIIDPPTGDLVNGKWSVTSFGTQYGLIKANTGYFLTDMITRDGLYCWGDNGFSVFDFAKKTTTIPQAFVSGINIMDGHQYFTGHKPETNNKLSWTNVNGPYNLPSDLQLPYNQNYLQFSYSVLDLAAHDTIWYRYKLAGYEKSWNSTAMSGTSKSYYNLAPGSYTFEIIAKTDDEPWSPVSKFTFTINPPWWQTWWAYIIYLAIFGGSVWSFAHFRSRKLVYDKRLLEDKIKERTEEVLQQKEEIEAQRDNLEKAFKDLKTTQAQLVQSEKMASLGELTAGIAHEIQNPLNFVNNFSEVNKEMLEELKIEWEKPNSERNNELELELINDIIANEEKINHHGKRADSIVKGMLEHSRARSGQKELTDINKLADEYLRLSYHGLRAKDRSFNAEMITHLDENLPRINVLPQDLGRVLLNLFNNAFYAVNEKKKTAGSSYKPTVELSTSFTDTEVLIIVKDNGTGIPDAVKDKIMQPFFTTKPTGEGTGLGLSLSYDIVVKGHGGSIKVDSLEGKKTEFIIALPLN